MALELKWKKCGDDSHWCNLKTVNLRNNADEGVYIIWHTGNPSKVVRIGQGIIANRLSEHRDNPKVTKYGELRVTWAVLDQKYRDSVERYLADNWNPLVGEAFPDANPIEVNSPFG